MAKVPLDVDSLKPNSHAYKEEMQQKANDSVEREKLTAVVKKDAVVRTKKSLGQKILEAFTPDDVQDVKSYVIYDVIIPTIKDTFLDVMGILLGRSGGRRSSDRDRDHVSYASHYKSEYNGRRSSSRRSEPRREDEKVDYRNIVLLNRRDAEEVVSELKRRIEVYQQATIADLFDLIDITGTYVDNNWGWTDERDIGIRRVSSGYLIDVAEARHLD